MINLFTEKRRPREWGWVWVFNIRECERGNLYGFLLDSFHKRVLVRSLRARHSSPFFAVCYCHLVRWLIKDLSPPCIVDVDFIGRTLKILLSLSLYSYLLYFMTIDLYLYQLLVVLTPLSLLENILKNVHEFLNIAIIPLNLQKSPKVFLPLVYGQKLLSKTHELCALFE